MEEDTGERVGTGMRNFKIFISYFVPRILNSNFLKKILNGHNVVFYISNNVKNFKSKYFIFLATQNNKFERVKILYGSLLSNAHSLKFIIFLVEILHVRII